MTLHAEKIIELIEKRYNEEGQEAAAKLLYMWVKQNHITANEFYIILRHFDFDACP